MKKYLLIILLFFVSINCCNAAQSYDRNDFDNYGVNKDIKINKNNLDDVLKTKYVDSSLKIYDYSDILTSTDEDNLRKLALSFYNKTGFDLVIVTDSFYNYDDEDNYEYAQNFYDYNDFGINDKYYSGVLILRNSYKSYPFYSIRTFGEAQLYFGGKRTETILDNTSSMIANANYSNAFKEVIKELENYYEEGIASEYKNYKIDKNGNLIAPYKFPFLLAIIIPGLFTFFYISFYVNKNKMVFKEKLAYDYLDNNSINYSVKNNKFINTTTRAIPRASDNNKRSSGGFKGSSGRSSSGGGRRV